MSRKAKSRPGLLRSSRVSVAVAAALSGVAISANAYDIDAGNPDVTMTWNNTARYNWARRMQSIDRHVSRAGPPVGGSGPLFTSGGPYFGGYGAADNLFGRGDTITNRLDLLSELNFNYQGKYGFRISAAAWYDAAYAGKKPTPDPTVAGLNTTVYAGNEFTDYVKRFYHGPSGEWLDAYVFGNFDISGSDLNVRLGRHSVVWGEGLIGSNHSIAYSQAPSDSRKSVSSPGASAKETALPVDQISATAVINPEFTLLAHYQFEWVPNRIPEGGTYFAPGDPVLWGANVNRNTEFKRGENGGYGIGLKWTPDWLDGTLGFYYRKFDDKGGWLSQVATPSGVAGVNFNTTAVWAKDIKIYGVSLSKNIAGVSMGAEVSHRENGPLSSMATVSAGAAGNYEGAVGDTWHGLLNGVMTFGSSPVYDSASLLGEVAWAKLDKVTKNPTLYRSMSNHTADCAVASTRNIRGCINGDFMSATFSFTPNWLQVYPGIDLAMPLLYAKNWGNSPSYAGGSDGFITYKVGVTATAWVRHIFDLSYTWWDQNVDRVTPYSGVTNVSGRLLGPPYSDKGFLSFTYQTTF